MLLFLKPDAVLRRYVGARVLKELLRLDLDVQVFERLNVPKEFLADVHYRIHKGKFFFEWLLDYICAGPVLVLVVEGDQAITRVRDTLGPTQPEKAVAKSPMSLRARYGIFGGVNCAHASDSRATSAEEVPNWMNRFKLSVDPHARRNLAEYIEKYIDYPTVDSLRYRELSEQVTSGELKPNEAEAQFRKLLALEGQGESSKALANLADVMVGNCLLPNR